MDKNFTVTNHEYINTGGNCMVSVFTVYDRSANATRYVVCGDEGLNWQSFDTITHEPPEGLDYDDVIIECHNYDALTCEPCWDNPVATMDDEKFLLFKYCEFEHYKKDCKYFGVRLQLPVDRLPAELYNELGVDAIEWHKENGDLVTTDGYQVWPSEGYEPPVAKAYIEHKAYVDKVVDFKQWFDNTVDDAAANDTLTDICNEPLMIAFNGRALRLNLNADEYDIISDALKKIVDCY